MSRDRHRAAAVDEPDSSPSRPGLDPDQPLLVRIGQGDQAAYGALMDRHLHAIHALAARTLGNAADADEVAQDTFLRAWKHIPGWTPGQARFSTWLYRVALNLCHDQLRRRRDTRPIDEMPLASEAPGPERLARRDDLAREVQQALALLPERQRDAIVLSHYQELSQREAAEVLEISVEALESLLSRGRRALREQLSHAHEPATGNADVH